jgi:hypothetical protein
MSRVVGVLSIPASRKILPGGITCLILLDSGFKLIQLPLSLHDRFQTQIVIVKMDAIATVIDFLTLRAVRTEEVCYVTV